MCDHLTNLLIIFRTPDEGPVYELQTDTEGDAKEKVLRSGKTTPTPGPDCNDIKPRSEPRPVPAPDIVVNLKIRSVV